MGGGSVVACQVETPQLNGVSEAARVKGVANAVGFQKLQHLRTGVVYVIELSLEWEGGFTGLNACWRGLK